MEKAIIPPMIASSCQRTLINSENGRMISDLQEGGERSNTTAACTYGNQSSYDILESMSNLRLEDWEVAYHTEVNGEYSCSGSLQSAGGNLGKCPHLGMLDTGASHYMLNDEKLFVGGSLVETRTRTNQHSFGSQVQMLRCLSKHLVSMYRWMIMGIEWCSTT